MNRAILIAMTLVAAIGFATPMLAAQEVQIGEAAVDEVAEAVMGDFTSQVASMGGRAVLTADIRSYAEEFGMAETRSVFETIGPEAAGVMDDVPHSLKSEAFSFMAQDGRKSLYVLQSSARRELFQADGISAAEAMARYPGIAEDAIAKEGRPAAEAINALDRTDATRLDAMIDDGSLAKEGNESTLLGRIARGGETTFDQIWKHRIGLLKAGGVGAVLVGGAGIALRGVGFLGHSVKSAVSGVAAASSATQSLLAAGVCLLVIAAILVGIIILFKSLPAIFKAVIARVKSRIIPRRRAAGTAAPRPPVVDGPEPGRRRER